MNNTKSYENWQCSGSSRVPAAELENTAKPSTPDSLSSVASPSLADCLVARDPDCVAFGFFYGVSGFLEFMREKVFLLLWWNLQICDPEALNCSLDYVWGWSLVETLHIGACFAWTHFGDDGIMQLLDLPLHAVLLLHFKTKGALLPLVAWIIANSNCNVSHSI